MASALAVVRSPALLVEWGSALALLFYFSNTLALLLRLDLQWPSSVVALMSLLALDTLIQRVHYTDDRM